MLMFTVSHLLISKNNTFAPFTFILDASGLLYFLLWKRVHILNHSMNYSISWLTASLEFRIFEHY